MSESFQPHQGYDVGNQIKTDYYDEQGRRIRTERYHPDGSFRGYHLYAYIGSCEQKSLEDWHDSDGNRIRRMWYHNGEMVKDEWRDENGHMMYSR